MSMSIPRYFTVLGWVKRWNSLNLRLWSIFFEFKWKLINSVLVTLRDNLLAFSHWDRLRPKFTRLATFCSEEFDCSMLVSLAKWKSFEYLTHLYIVAPEEILEVNQFRLVWVMNQTHLMWQTVFSYLSMTQTNFQQLLLYHINQVSQVECCDPLGQKPFLSQQILQRCSFWILNVFCILSTVVISALLVE